MLLKPYEGIIGYKVDKGNEMINVEKELAFLDLATDILKYTRSERAFIREWINKGHEFSGRIWEELIEKLARTKFNDTAHMDFTDGTEAKTASTRLYKKKEGSTGIVGQITNVAGKTGYIRVACYNNHSKKIDFFVLPPNHDVTIRLTKSQGNKGCIQFSYSRKDDTYSANLEKYRVKNIKECCKQFRYLKLVA